MESSLPARRVLMFTRPPRMTAVDEEDLFDEVAARTQEEADDSEGFVAVAAPALRQVSGSRRSGSRAATNERPQLSAQPVVGAAAPNTRPLHDASMLSPARTPRSKPPDSTTRQSSPATRRSAQPDPQDFPSKDLLASEDANFVVAWSHWTSMLFQKTGEYVDPELTARVLAQPLPVAQQILSTVTSARVERPVGMLIWKLKNLESAVQDGPYSPYKPARGNSGASSGSTAPVRAETERPAGRNAASREPPNRLQPAVPLYAAVRGESDAFDSQMLFCLACGEHLEFHRRAFRAGGVNQPLGYHRYAQHGCGARVSVQEHGHFPGVFHLHFAVNRPETSAQPSPAESAAAAAAGHRTPTPFDWMHCTGCSQKLVPTVFDPVQHLMNSVEYSCPRCQETYVGFLCASGRHLSGSLLRRRVAGAPESNA